MSDKELIAAARQPTESYREALDKIVTEYDMALYTKEETLDRLSRAAVPDAATELAAIKARAEEVDEDEGWHIGGAWGDYGEVVVPLRILSYVVDGALDEKIVSTDPGYAATYAEQVARADHAEAERDAALVAVARVRTIHVPFTHPQFPGDRVYCKGCAVAGRGEKSWPCETRVALDGAPEPEEKK